MRIVATYDYIFMWDEDLGVEHFDPEDLSFGENKERWCTDPHLPPCAAYVFNLLNHGTSVFSRSMALCLAYDLGTKHYLQNDFVSYHGTGLDFALRKGNTPLQHLAAAAPPFVSGNDCSFSCGTILTVASSVPVRHLDSGTLVPSPGFVLVPLTCLPVFPIQFQVLAIVVIFNRITALHVFGPTMGILDELKTDLAQAKEGKSLLKGADGKPKKNLNPVA
ncbi:hypothetical protein RHSIM_Rhsim12G0118400 [Rhododendron simsii]|uniref:Uncharacterized protein n=1 Tax=Rhododendron simsii TaxID=118357 RepID=A0A834G290_RHOSS|nr:hypothetical protein RHSIM_Rhsim12G0118400 [Rhododendron simsii]